MIYKIPKTYPCCSMSCRAILTSAYNYSYSITIRYCEYAQAVMVFTKKNNLGALRWTQWRSGGNIELSSEKHSLLGKHKINHFFVDTFWFQWLTIFYEWERAHKL